MQNVTIVGLGIIGSAWARNLQEDGLKLRAWNRSPKDVPYFEGDLVRAVEAAEMIIIIVADPPAVNGILKTIEPHLRAGQMVVQSSTISAHWTRQFAERVEATGANFLEAPFTGSKLAAEARATIFYTGGATENMERARPVLARLSKEILHVGELGSASSLKLALNLNLALMSEALAECLTLARAEKIPDEIFFQALKSNAGRSGFSDLKEPKFKGRDYSPQFALKHMAKDVRLALETASTLTLPISVTLKTLQEKGLESNLGDDDFIGLIRLTDRVK